MAITRAKKAEIFEQLKEDFNKATAVYFAKYCGLSVKDVDAMRAKVRETNAKMRVAKKTLIQLAAKEAGYSEIPGESMEGPVAAIFAFEDQVTPAKAVHDFLKNFEELALIGALMDGNVLSKAEAQQLATLPSRDELLARLVGSMNAPISGFHGVLHGVLREFVGVVAAYKDKKSEGGEAAPIEEPKAETAPEVEAPVAEENAPEATEPPAEAAPDAAPAEETKE